MTIVAQGIHFRGARARLAPMPSPTTAEIEQAIRSTIPLAGTFPWDIREAHSGTATLTAHFGPEHIRAGGTVSGPMLFTLADTAMYVAVLATLGLSLLAVTSDTTIHFLRRLPPGDAIATAAVLRRGRHLLVSTVNIARAEDGETIAHAIGTYAI